MFNPLDLLSMLHIADSQAKTHNLLLELKEATELLQKIVEATLTENKSLQDRLNKYGELIKCESDDGEKGTCRENLPYNRFRWCRGCLNADQMEKLLEEENARDGS